MDNLLLFNNYYIKGFPTELKRSDLEKTRKELTTVIEEIFVRDLISYISYFRLKVRNLVAYENHARTTVCVTPSSLHENLAYTCQISQSIELIKLRFYLGIVPK